MMDKRTIEDRLREEYFELLPEIRRVAEHLEAKVRYCVLPISRKLQKYERLVITSRIKECDSALDSLRRRREGGTFDRDQPGLYTLTALNDLAGVRVLTFPRYLMAKVNRELRKRFPCWKADPVPGCVEGEEPLAFKYHGCCEASTKVRGELQIVSMLIGLFWEVEHSAIYKAAPRLKGVARSLEMQDRTRDVLNAFRAFEEQFEDLVRRDPFKNHKEGEH